MFKTLVPVNGEGVETPQSPDDGYTRLAVDTYFFPADIGDDTLTSFQIVTDATVAGTFTLETSNWPRTDTDGPFPVSDYAEGSADVGKWVQENPSTAYVGTTGTGFSATALTLTKTAGIGGATFHVSLGSRRARIKAVITVGGNVRITTHRKKP